MTGDVQTSERVACLRCGGFNEVITPCRRPGGERVQIISPCPACCPPAPAQEDVPW